MKTSFSKRKERVNCEYELDLKGELNFTKCMGVLACGREQGKGGQEIHVS